MHALVWLRSDLRVRDNPALAHACSDPSRGVVALFLASPDQWAKHDWGDTRVEFLRRTLESLADDLDALNIPFLIEDAPRFEDAAELIESIMVRHDCKTLAFNREYEINERRRDDEINTHLVAAGFDVHAYTDQVVLPPGSLRTGKGDFYTVFSPFKRKWIEHVTEMGVPKPTPRPRTRTGLDIRSSDVPAGFKGFSSPEIDWDLWPVGEQAATKRLHSFLRHHGKAYDDKRDIPAADGTSSLSPYLANGSISIRQCLHAAYEANGESLDGTSGLATWISELIWREFYRHILVGYPRVSMHQPFQMQTEKLTWNDDASLLDAWKEGRTGYPIVDAAQRQLLATGWMHNRLRMVSAMFLTKQCFVDWREGERHFMRHLIDGDLASNNGGWQWSASTGTDAAPYFRIFNPYSQSKRFDPEGVFIRSFVPELQDVPIKALHDPKHFPEKARAAVDYPMPIVEHSSARQRAIDAFKSIS